MKFLDYLFYLVHEQDVECHAKMSENADNGLFKGAQKFVNIAKFFRVNLTFGFVFFILYDLGFKLVFGFGLIFSGSGLN